MTPFSTGETISNAQANYDGRFTYGSGQTGGYRNGTVPVRSFDANPWDLWDMHGNVWEWCEDVFHANYTGVPDDGSPWLSEGDKTRHVVRGGSWYDPPRNLRSAYRDRAATDSRDADIGFRIVLEIGD